MPAVTLDPARRRLLAALAATPLAACASRAAGDGEPAFTAENLALAMRRQPCVLLGEVHDNAVQHRVRAQALALLLADGARPAIAFEQFDREQQAAIDAARAAPGDDRAARVIEAAGRGGWNWALYRPFIALALQFDLPIVAANLSRAEAMQVGRAERFDPVFDAAAQRQLGLDRLPDDFLRRHEKVVDDGHCNTMPPHLLRALAKSQISRDAMLLTSIRPHAARGVVLLTGNGHARADLGVPFLMAPDERARTLAVGLLETPLPGSESDAGAADLERAKRQFDVAFVTPRQERADPCAALRQRSPT
jgi:uncharacterized iron-regulated protein